MTGRMSLDRIVADCHKALKRIQDDKVSDSCEMCDAFRSHLVGLGCDSDSDITTEKCYFIRSCDAATPEEKLMHTEKWQMVPVCALLHEDGRMKRSFDFSGLLDEDDVGTFRLTRRDVGNQRRRAIMDQRNRRRHE
jgi:hypothetical protein